jgi:hypothetical protein
VVVLCAGHMRSTALTWYEKRLELHKAERAGEDERRGRRYKLRPSDLEDGTSVIVAHLLRWPPTQTQQLNLPTDSVLCLS